MRWGNGQLPTQTPKERKIINLINCNGKVVFDRFRFLTNFYGIFFIFSTLLTKNHRNNEYFSKLTRIFLDQKVTNEYTNIDIVKTVTGGI